MRLHSAQIRNFRSIRSVTLNFEPRCRILVGINESGKSNILRALALLDTDRKVEAGDARDFLPDESPSEPSFVRFVFVLTKVERDAMYQAAQPKILSRKNSDGIVLTDGVALTLRELVDTRNEGLYTVDVRSGKRAVQWWRLPENYIVAAHWRKVTTKTPPTFKVAGPNGEEVLLKSYLLIHSDFAEGVPEEYLAEPTLEDIAHLVHVGLTDLVTENLPGCLYWAYSETNLLPPQIPLDQFSSNPAMCEPLRQMFILADVANIKEAIADAKSRPNGLRNLLNRVAGRATRHMKQVWKEYRGITIELAPNGAHIDASVRDEHNLYDFARRSDGFKRFITFLLMVSARVKTDDLQDTLYLHDEPEISLHPSGARYLRDELVAIAKQNYVVFSTHSIFMVDRELHRRHLIVEKKGEITTVRDVDESNITDEEVIYNALGYSLFDTLRRRNIVFEGWRDKKLFEVALKGLTGKRKALRASFEDVGMCHARGVKDIERITPMLELAARSWIVISDADKVAVEHQKLYRGNGPWLRYDELLPESGVVTAEDFILADAYKSVVDDLRKENAALSDILPDLTATRVGKLSTLRKWLATAGFAGDPLRDAVESVKESLFGHLKPSHIDDTYYAAIEVMAEHLARDAAAAG